MRIQHTRIGCECEKNDCGWKVIAIRLPAVGPWIGYNTCCWNLDVLLWTKLIIPIGEMFDLWSFFSDSRPSPAEMDMDCWLILRIKTGIYWFHSYLKVSWALILDGESVANHSKTVYYSGWISRLVSLFLNSPQLVQRSTEKSQGT